MGVFLHQMWSESHRTVLIGYFTISTMLGVLNAVDDNFVF